MLRKAGCVGEYAEKLGPPPPSPTFWFLAAFRAGLMALLFYPEVWQDSCLQKQATVPAQNRAEDSTLAIQRRMNRRTPITVAAADCRLGPAEEPGGDCQAGSWEKQAAESKPPTLCSQGASSPSTSPCPSQSRLPLSDAILGLCSSHPCTVSAS